MYRLSTAEASPSGDSPIETIIPNSGGNHQSRLADVLSNYFQPHTVRTSAFFEEHVIPQIIAVPETERTNEPMTDIQTGSSLSIVILVLMAYLAFLDHYRKGK